MFSGVTNGEPQVVPEYEPRLDESEYSAGEARRFATLALRKTPSAKLSDMPEREGNRSLRINNVWRPLGVDQGLRVPSWPMERAGGGRDGAYGLRLQRPRVELPHRGRDGHAASGAL